MASSTAPTAITNLISAVTTQCSSDAAHILVTLGLPDANVQDVPNDVIFLTGAVDRPITPQTFIGSLGTGALRESYNFDVNISTFANDTAANVLSRVWVLVGYVEAALRADPTIGGAVELSWPQSTSGGEPQAVQEPAGWQCDLTVTIHAESTI